MKRLEGKAAIVTGSGRGIGQAVALKLASEGARLVINDLDAEPAQAVAAQIRGAGGEAVVCAGSVTAPDFAERLIKTCVDSYKSIDIIINNAGYTWDSVIQKMSDEQWYAMIDVHLTAPFRILRAAQPVIRALNKDDLAAGREVLRKVVNISSVAGLGGNAGQANYAAAKAGITGLTKTLSKDWGLRADQNAAYRSYRQRQRHRKHRRPRHPRGRQPGTHGHAREEHPARPRRHAGGSGGGGVPVLHARVRLHFRPDHRLRRRHQHLAEA